MNIHKQIYKILIKFTEGETQMKITMTENEMKAMTDIMAKFADSGIISAEEINEFNKSIDEGVDNQLSKITKDLDTGTVTVSIEERCIVDIYKLYGKYIPTFIGIAKTLMSTADMFVGDMTDLAEKWYSEVDCKKESVEGEDSTNDTITTK